MIHPLPDEVVEQARHFDLCPWGCNPRLSIKDVAGPEPNFPDRHRAVVSCSHARIEGEKHLVIGDADWRALGWLWNARAPTPTPTEQSVLRGALERRDRKAGECPDAKLDPDKECPRCGAMSDEGCRVTALADAAFVHAARKALEATSVPDGDAK